MAPKVSIIIPVYNTGEYLKECLDSVCAQSEPDIEMIVVDDASTDGSGEVLTAYAQKDQRITAVRHPQNKRQGGARNTGIQMAQGTWLLFVDSDDTIRRDCVEILLELAERYPGADLIMHDLA
ncbi:MAG: glycosyltransferase family 2 protein, partial [Spirochaetota bacterium]